MWVAVLAFIKSIPIWISSLMSAVASVQGLTIMIAEMRKKGWIDKGNEITKTIKNVSKKVRNEQTDEELRKLVRDLAQHTSARH